MRRIFSFFLFFIFCCSASYAAYPTTTEHHKVYPYTSIMAAPYSGDPTGTIDCVAAIESIKANQSNVGTIHIPKGVFKIGTNLTIPAGMRLYFESGATFSIANGVTLTVNGSVFGYEDHRVFTLVGSGNVVYNLVRLYRVSEFASLSDALASIGSASATLLIDKNVTIAADVTFPVTLSIQVLKGVILAVNNTKTLTIGGPLEAGLYQIFSWTGTGAVKFAYTSPQIDIYPEWWGATGTGGSEDGETDDLAALNACRDSMVATISGYNYGRGIMHLSRWYAVSSTFSVDLIGNYNDSGMIFRGTGKYNSGLIGTAACDNKPVMEIMGSPNIEISNFGIAGIVTNYPETSYAGTAAPSVGLLLARANGTGGGNGYNSRIIDIGFWGYFRFGNLFNWAYSDTLFSGIQAWTSPINTTPKQWMFEFFNGNCSKTRKFTDIVGTNAEILTSPAAYGGGENNKFYNIYTYTSNDSWKAAGAAGIYSFGFTPYCEKVFLGGVADYAYYCLDTNISIKDCGGDGHGTVAGIYMASDAEADHWPASCIAEADVNNFLNKSTAPIFVTDANTQLNYSVLYHLRGNNNLKILLGKGAWNCRFEANETMTSFVVTAGLFWYNSLDIPFACANFQIDPGAIQNCTINDQRNVGSGDTINLGGGSDVRIGRPGGADYGGVIPFLYFGHNKLGFAAAAPISGSWSQGDEIKSTVATTGTTVGWKCILDNTFGTLNSGGTTGSIDTATALLTVNAVTGLSMGNWIDIAGVTGPLRVININPTTKVVTLSGNSDATVAGGAVSFHNHTTADAFKAMPGVLP